ncbi:c-type cytochrome [Massilia agilis]|uniref:C-type cytochrome n=1 Tax=Massilia agilis TaxID=1811226 RepID=A0ABT2D6Z0_9BURK|nr:c-type cytochrome [Massilia agilis]
MLHEQGFTGRVEESLERRLGRKLDPKLADVGRLLFFDRISNLHNDNTCAGCHAPTNGFGDSQPMAIGIQSNLLVGPHRLGPRNQRRTPTVVNVAFYPRLMWNGRFAALSGDPFNNALGYQFPLPEGVSKFGPNNSRYPHLLVAQAHMPPTELNEAAGFTGVLDGINPRLQVFDDGKGMRVPGLDASGWRNDAIRDVVVQRLNAVPEYVQKFGGPVDIDMFAKAIAEFEFTLVRANAPLDRFARGDTGAMTVSQKHGALLFFGKANCVACHGVRGESNEMFSDFRMHNIGVPQIAPAFGPGKGNTIFDGPDENEDFGLEQVTGEIGDRYKFRTSPLRNLAVQPAFFHNGAFVRLEDAVRHHLDVIASLKNYDAAKAGVAPDLVGRTAPVDKVSATLDPKLGKAVALTEQEFADLVDFLRNGLLDERVKPGEMCKLVPDKLPSGPQFLKFEGCR